MTVIATTADFPLAYARDGRLRKTATSRSTSSPSATSTTCGPPWKTANKLPCIAYAELTPEHLGQPSYR